MNDFIPILDYVAKILFKQQSLNKIKTNTRMQLRKRLHHKSGLITYYH